MKKPPPPPEVAAPLAVPPAEAARLLSICLSKLYEKLRSGELPSYDDDGSRRIPMAAIKLHVQRQLAASAAGWKRIKPQPDQRRRRAAGGRG